MKQIIALILIVFLSISCNAQNTYPLSNFETKNLKNNNYIEDSENVLNNFVGIWQWTSGTTIFTVKLQKVEHWKAPNDKYYKDVILGGYSYVHNGTLVIDKLVFTTNFPSDELSGETFSKIIGSITYPSIGTLKSQVYDIIKGKLCYSEMKLQTSSSGIPQLHWTLKDQEYYRLESEGAKPLDFSIPTDVILTKLP